MEINEFEFYGEIRRTGTSSYTVLIPKSVIETSQWKAGDRLKLRGIKHSTQELSKNNDD